MRLLITLFATILFFGAAAQDKFSALRVILKTEKKDTMQGATIQIMTLPDTILISSQIYKKEGTVFQVRGFSKYYIIVSCTGFITERKTVNMADNPVDVILIMKRNTVNLKEVVVVTKQPLMKQEDDKTIVDAAQLASSSSNAYEVLEKTPGIIADQDGNIYLNSMNTAMVYINGREMKLTGQDLAALLKNLPASSISKIEILRNPSAKYDAETVGGIVNIVLRKKIKPGTNINFNAGYFQGVYATKTAGFTFNNTSGKAYSYFNYQFTQRNNYEELKSFRNIYSDTSKLSQSAYSTYPFKGNFISMGTNVSITNKLTIGADMRLNPGYAKTFTENSSIVTKGSTSGSISENTTDIYNKNKSFILSGVMSAKYRLDSTGSEWTAEVGYQYFDTKIFQDYSNLIKMPSLSLTEHNGNTSAKKHIYTFQTDVIKKFKEKITVEMGLKFSVANNSNDAVFFYRNNINPSWIADNYQTNRFKYAEKITSSYFQVARRIGGFIFKPGIRLEITDFEGRQIIPVDTSFKFRRTNVFPYLFISHKLFRIFKTDLIGNIIFRKSIKRPFYELLSPAPRYYDQYLYDVGNPSLKPQFNNTYEASITFNGYPVFTFGMINMTDVFANVVYPDDATRIAYRTYDNIGKNKELYFRVLGGLPPGGKYFFYAGVQHNHNHYTGLYETKPLNFKRGTTTFFMFHEVKVSKGFSFNLQGFYRTGGLQSFVEIGNLGALGFSCNKSVLKGKGNIILSATDMFKTNKVNFVINQGTVYTTGLRVNDTRRAGITFKYNLGLNKPKEGTNFGDDVEGKEN